MGLGGSPNTTALENTIFRGGYHNGTTPKNAFPKTVKCPMLETLIFKIGVIVAVSQLSLKTRFNRL
jgi:hypothetical protein